MKNQDLHISMNSQVVELMDFGYTENEALEMLSDTFDQQGYRDAYICE